MANVVYMPELQANEFLPIFIVSVLVLLFGVAYAGAVTLAKMGFLKKRWLYIGHIFWVIQTFCLYKLSVLIHSSHFTTKVLMVAMVVYLFIPHLYFYLVDASAKRYED